MDDQWSGVADEAFQMQATNQLLMGSAFEGLDACKTCSQHAHPAHKAASSGHLRCLRILCHKSVGVSHEIDKHGASPLYYATQEGHLNSVKWLVREGGADVLQQASDGMTSIHAAAQSGRLRCLQFLFRHCKRSAFDNIKDNEGATPLHVAAGCGNVACLKFMLSSGGTGNEKDNIKATPVHDAAEHGQMECMQVLAEHGALLNPKDEDSLTPRSLALEEGHHELARFLAQALARVERGEKIFEGPGALVPAPARKLDQPESDDDEDSSRPASRIGVPNIADLFTPISPPKIGSGSVAAAAAAAAGPGARAPGGLAAAATGAAPANGRPSSWNRLGSNGSASWSRHGSNGAPRHSMASPSSLNSTGEEAQLLEALDDLRFHMDKMSAVTSQLHGNSNRNSGVDEQFDSPTLAVPPMVSASPGTSPADAHRTPSASPQAPSTPVVIRSAKLKEQDAQDKTLLKKTSKRRAARSSSVSSMAAFAENPDEATTAAATAAAAAVAAGPLSPSTAPRGSGQVTIRDELEQAEVEAGQLAEQLAAAESELCKVPADNTMALLQAQQKVREAQQALYDQQDRQLELQRRLPHVSPTVPGTPSPKADKKTRKEEKRRQRLLAKGSPKQSPSSSPRNSPRPSRWSFFGRKD
eukprot:m.128004 g.128004  ORF g.128004 m.128004 type:complete len:642 (-) comp16723_c1_seq3:112-2037(-)